MSIYNCSSVKLSVRRSIRNILTQTLVGMKVTILVVAAGELILGMLGNVFIALVNCIEWVKKGKVSSADSILISLAIARVIQLWVTLVDSFIMGLNPHLYAAGELAKAVTILSALTHHLTTWFATCLSIFYFLKIANFSHFFFLWLKWRIKRVVLMLFLGSFFALPITVLLQDALNELWTSVYRVHERNMTLPLQIDQMFYLKSLLLLSLSYVIPFLLSLSSLFLLLLSLVRHTKNSQLNLMSSRDSSTEAHRRAMKMVTTFLFLFIIYSISNLAAVWIFNEVQSSQTIMIFMLISNVFPSIHSFIIILGNSKLRQIAVGLLWHLKFSEKNKVTNFIERM